MDSLPLISCMMPTRNRPELAMRAIELFLAQDYENCELVIWDSGIDRLPDGEWTGHPRIIYRHYFQAPEQSLGHVRNAMNASIKTDFIAHWDDDDWYAPTRLSEQFALLLHSDAEVCGVEDVFFFNPDTKRAWRFRWSGAKPWLSCATLLYSQALWLERPLAEVHIVECTQWLWAQPALRQVAADKGLYAARIHAANTAAKHTRGLGWQAIAWDDLPEGARHG